MKRLEQVLEWPKLLDVSRTLGLHPNSVYRWVRARKVDGFLLGNVWHVNPKSLADFLEERTKRLEARDGN